MREKTTETDRRKFLLDAIKLVGIGKCDDDVDDDDDLIPYLFTC
jgi:hypothetical protein